MANKQIELNELRRFIADQMERIKKERPLVEEELRKAEHVRTLFPNKWIALQGGNYKVRTISICPYHIEKTPSMALTGESHDEEPAVSAGDFYCFGCGAKGAWEYDPSGEQYVGDSGISTPTKIILTKE